MNTPIPIPPKQGPPQSSFRAARKAEMTEMSRSTFLRRRRHEQSAAVTFSPLAWLKLLMFLHAGDTEVGGFGISAEKQPLYIEDFVTVKQTVTAVTVAFDDTAVADFFDDCIDRGLTPARFARIWVHTHPGKSPEPSSVDEETFARVFGDCDWAVMLIVSRTHATYARLSFSAGPGGSVLLPVKVDWPSWPQLLLDYGAELSAQFESWMDEYGKNVCPEARSMGFGSPCDSRDARSAWSNDLWREDEIYSLHERSQLDHEFADYFETVVMEER
jgi:proteasome lid subunit RPN8/RPN11